jgi:hypothetical protein
VSENFTTYQRSTDKCLFYQGGTDIA